MNQPSASFPLLLTAGAVGCGIAILAAAAPPDQPRTQRARLDETAVRIEINDTDGDAGLQIFADAEEWRWMKVKAPNGTIMRVTTDGNLRVQGLTEMFFESSEPGFDELPLDVFLERFPEGKYKFRGKTIEGDRLRGSAILTHALPDAPEILVPAEDDVVDPDNAFVMWSPVDDPPGSKIVGYQVIVETDEGKLRIFSVDVPADVTTVSIPPEFLEPDTEFACEVLAIEKSGNQVISEVSFATQ